MKTHVMMVVMLCLLGFNPICGAQTTNDVQIKEVIASIQTQITDLTDSLEPLYNAKFLATRNAMTEPTARQIVELIRQGVLTNNTQADIGVLLLSGLKEQTYWVVTEPLLTTNTDEEVMGTLLCPPFPYGPGYANTYKIAWYKNRLLRLRDESHHDNGTPDFDFILSGEDAKSYADYLKHPHKYGY
jgi:hypothetical protein